MENPAHRKIVLLGSVPAKKNARQVFSKNGRIINIASTRYYLWEKDALIQLLGIKPVTSYPVAVTLVFTVKDNRSRDLDNMAASVLDCLQKAGVLESDDWQHCRPITLDILEVDKLAPGVAVYLEEDR